MLIAVRYFPWIDIPFYKDYAPLTFTLNRIEQPLFHASIYLSLHFSHRLFFDMKFWMCFERLGLSIYITHSFVLVHFYSNITDGIDTYNEVVVRILRLFLFSTFHAWLCVIFSLPSLFTNFISFIFRRLLKFSSTQQLHLYCSTLWLIDR